jgi:HPt (histidine-containing phosphotransfer) domain-containing protein
MGSVSHEELAGAVETADPHVLDLIHLRRYTMGNTALEQELLGLFLGQLPALLQQISEVAAAEDWKFALHTLKGSARAIGAHAIADIAETLEPLGPSGDIAAHLSGLAVEAARFEEAARKLLN